MYTRSVVMPGGSWWNFDFVELIHSSTSLPQPEVTKLLARMLSIPTNYTMPLPVEYENESEMPGTKYSVALLPCMKS